MKLPNAFVCEVCCGEDFEEVFLPNPEYPTARTGLYSCCACHLVFKPNLPLVSRGSQAPAPPALSNYGLRSRPKS